MDEEDYFKILGINKDTKWEDIKKTFLRKALETHPDRGGNEAEFKKANTAYQYFRQKHENKDSTNESKTYEAEVERGRIFDKIITSLSLVLGRVNFFAFWAGLVGVLALILGGFLIVDSGDSFELGIYCVLVGVVLSGVAALLYLENKKILKRLGDLVYIKKHLGIISIVSLVFGLIATPIFAYVLPLVGIFSLVYFFSILLNTSKAYYFIYKYINFDKQKSKNKNHSKINLLSLIYPKVRHDIWWHRLVSVLGWIISICSLWLIVVVFPLYFGMIQRIIYFVAYGEDKSKWQK
jgi:uncharacterized membrane protein YidH (DUF202 family)